MIAVGMILSYVESLLPTFIPIAGVKLGLANVSSVIALVLLGAPAAICVSLLRVLLSALLFGNASTLIYSLFGAFISLLGMMILKRFNCFSAVGISVAGGVLHNLGQLLAAAIMMDSTALFYYLPPLIFFGALSGALIGIASGILAKRLDSLGIFKR